ncbi:MAG: PHP domain-containing protein [Candidatus Methanospirareceae archaeon]
MKYDLHVHSKYSKDSTLEPERIVKIAKRKGLNGIAITDHDTIKGGLAAKKYEDEDLEVIIGSEVHTEKGDIIGLFISEEIKSKDVMEVIDEIKEQGGLVIVPHPFDSLRRSSFHITEEYASYVDAIEGFNSRCIFEKFNSKAKEFGKKYNIPLVGGSDAHFPNEIGKGGIITEDDDIRDAILKNEVILIEKKSPFVIIDHMRSKMIMKKRRKRRV